LNPIGKEKTHANQSANNSFCARGASATLWAADDPAIGSWKLNVAKSKYSTGQAPKSQTLKIEAAGDGLKLTADVVNADGTTQHLTYTAKPDGKEYPVAGDPDRDTTTMKQVDAYTTEVMGKKAGKPTVNFRRVASKDGKTLMVTGTGTDAKGQKVNTVAVYDKQ